MISEAPPSHWTRALYASAAAQFLCMMGTSFALPFLPFYLRELGVSDPAEVRKWAGIVAAASGLSMAVFAPIWGAVGDRFGKKVMVLRSMFALAAMMALMTLARTPGQLAFLRLVQGALSGTITANMALIACVAPRERAGYALGMIHAAAHAGRIIGPSIGGVLADHFGFRPSFWAGAGLVFGAGALIALFTAEPQARIEEGEEEGGGSCRALFTIGAFLIGLAAMFQVTFATHVAMPLFPLFVEALHSDPKSAASVTGAILAVNAVAGVVATGVLGRAGDRWGHKRMLLLTTLAASGILLLHAAARSVTDLFLLRALLGLASAGILPSASAIIRNVVRERDVGKAFGLSQSVRSAASALGPLAGGYLSAQFAGLLGFRIPFLATGVLMLLVPAIVAGFLKESEGRPSAAREGRGLKSAAE